MIQTVNVPLPLGDGAVELPAHAGTELAEVPPDAEPPPLPWLESLLLPQPAAASATVAAQTANMVTRFTVAVLPCPANVLTGLV
jgi:hypothetical protein